MWNADPAYWGRTSPVLFPFVGGVRDKKYRIGDREYPMGQHGFARDREFVLTEQSGATAWFALEDDAASREVYPFRFRLEIGYRLEGQSLHVMWRVRKPGYERDVFCHRRPPGLLLSPAGRRGAERLQPLPAHVGRAGARFICKPGVRGRRPCHGPDCRVRTGERETAGG